MTPTISSLPPGPKSPSVWQLVRYSHSPLPYIESCSRRYGAPFTFKMAGYGKLVMLGDPEAVRDVFRAEPHELHSGEGNEFLSATVGKHSVLVLDDEPHRRQRRHALRPARAGSPPARRPPPQ